MGRTVTPAEQPTYEQLEEIVRRQDNLLHGLYFSMEGLRAAAWLAHHAHGSGNVGYSEDEYAGDANHLFRFLADRTRATYDDFSEAHRGIRASVLAGLPEGEEAHHG